MLGIIVIDFPTYSLHFCQWTQSTNSKNGRHVMALLLLKILQFISQPDVRYRCSADRFNKCSRSNCKQDLQGSNTRQTAGTRGCPLKTRRRGVNYSRSLALLYLDNQKGYNSTYTATDIRDHGRKCNLGPIKK